MKIHEYNLKGKVNKTRRIAHIADLHDRDAELLLICLRAKRPDIITIAGDLTNNRVRDTEKLRRTLCALAGIAPSFYSLGNHEYNFTEKSAQMVADCGVRLLMDEYALWNELCIGALRSRSVYRPFPKGRKTAPPRLGWLDEFEKQSAYKILLSHHPEYYEPYLEERNIDLILSGHAHGGQVRLFNHGLFAPGQGIWPKYTKGLHDGRFIISAGLANTEPMIPRLFNPIELVIIDIEKKDAAV